MRVILYDYDNRSIAHIGLEGCGTLALCGEGEGQGCEYEDGVPRIDTLTRATCRHCVHRFYRIIRNMEEPSRSRL